MGRFNLRRKPIIREAVSINILKKTQEEIEAKILDKKMIEEYKKAIILFTRVLKKEAPHFDMSIFMANLDKLNVKSSQFDIIHLIYGFCASYDEETGIVRVKRKQYLKSIFHELFHAASVFSSRGYWYSGLSQRGKNFTLGEGLKEGYTDLLGERYFKGLHKSGYIIEQYFARCVEHIVGRKEMEMLYSKADLKGLVDILSIYKKREEVINFLKDFDYVYKKCTAYINDKKEIKRRITKVLEFINECYIEKQKMRVIRKEITVNNYLSNIKRFRKDLYKGIMFDVKYYNYFSSEEIKDLQDQELKRVA